MKSAGNAPSNLSLFWCGQPHCAKGMQPESNQQSMTSGTRRMVPLHFEQGIVTWSIHGLWMMRCSLSVGSAARARRKWSKAWGLRFSISARLAGASLCSASASQIQTLSGVPHQRSRDSAQSTLFARKSPKRPSLMWSGSQCTARLFAMALSFRAVVRMYQAGRAYWMSGSESARQQNG